MEEQKKRLVLVTHPSQGHLNPMLELASILHSRGFSITVVHTRFSAPTASNYPNFTFISIPDDNQAPEGNFFDQLALLNHKCIAPFKDYLLMILSQDQEQFACIIFDAVMGFAKVVADDLQLPRLALRTSNATSFLALSAVQPLRQNGFPVQDSELDMPVDKLQGFKVRDLPGVSSKNPEPLFQVWDMMLNNTKGSHGLIFNTFEYLEHHVLETIRKEFEIPVFSIGPFHRMIPASSSGLLKQDSSCISWLNTQAPGTVLYVSFGSMAEIDKTDLLEIAWGLANSERPFLWVLRTGLVRDSSSDNIEELLPQSFHDIVSERGYIVKWAPQQEVLAHPAVGGFWTHSGWNSTLESICEGVPMICWPYFSDQMLNARYVSDIWRVGLKLEQGLKLEEIESAIRKLMVGEEREEIMRNARNLKDKAELCQLKGGSSFNSLQNLVDLILSF